MKKNKIIIFAVLFVVIAALAVLAFFMNNKKSSTDNKDYFSDFSDAQKTSFNVNQEIAQNRIYSIVENKNEILNNIDSNTGTEISSYSTQIKDKSEGRLVNIELTCSALNGAIIHKGETFSFNQVVGKPTIEKGYKEASIIINHKTEKGIGGGNCQVSSTLYNAVLEAGNSLTVIERHPHGKSVTYVPKDRDAAVSYGSLDFKFRNDSNSDICINASSDNNTISITLLNI